MRQTLLEGLDLAQQLVALPFRAARQSLRDSTMGSRPLGEVLEESLQLGEGLATLPWKATAAVLHELTATGPSLEQRVSNLESRIGMEQSAPPPPEIPPA